MTPAPAFGGDELVIDRDLEHPAPRRNEHELGDVLLKLLQQPLRQTDGSRTVASLSAVLDRDVHGGECRRSDSLEQQPPSLGLRAVRRIEG
jgi:hypothetical protein